MALINLVYVSLSARDMTDAELQEILAVARAHNTTKDITGMLLYRDGYFIQALEGEETEVDTLYTKIQKDPRHHHILTVFRNPIEKRVFNSWAMGFNHIADIDPDKMPGFTDFMEKQNDHKFFTEHPGRAVQLLEHFRDHTYF
jgi:Sensors of blue-light using FAD